MMMESQPTPNAAERLAAGLKAALAGGPDEIRARGGDGLWAETALESAIRTGETHDY
jgi:hypothetical protein